MSRDVPLGYGGTSGFTLRLEPLLSVSTKWLLERRERKSSERFTSVRYNFKWMYWNSHTLGTFAFVDSFTMRISELKA